ncbi:hypothetical protein HDU76_013953 [Blyttiomyces sp. JEL0837]|nr:hypothetical protein HDU76_013953 [Blyttiomyces sp. JEL0837]
MEDPMETCDISEASVTAAPHSKEVKDEHNEEDGKENGQTGERSGAGAREEIDYDSVLARMVGMGFDMELSLAAVSECAADGDSPMPSPKPSRPPPPGAKPSRGILKTSPDLPRAQLPSATGFFKKDWISKQMNQAVNVFGSTLTKVKEKATILAAQASANINMGSGAGNASSQFHEIDEDSAPFSQHTDGRRDMGQTVPLAKSLSNVGPFVIGDGTGSRDSLTSVNAQNPNGGVNAKDSHTIPASSLSKGLIATIGSSSSLISGGAGGGIDGGSNNGSNGSNGVMDNGYPALGSARSLDKLSKRVRFSFPDIRIAAEEHEGSSPETGDAERQSALASSTSAADAEVRAGQVAAARRVLEIDEVYQYYHNKCGIRGEEPIDALDTQMRDAFEATMPLSRIDLSGVPIGPHNVGALADLLLADFGLKQLSLDGCGLEDEVLKTKSLKYLDMSGVQFDRRGAAYLNHALGYGSCTLEYLKLEDCRIRASLLETLCPGIRRSQIRHLSFRNNRMPWDCAPYLADLIWHDRSNSQHGNNSGPQYARCLKTLDLRGNDLRHGITAFCVALARADVLQGLNLRENKLDPSNLYAIADALRVNTGLRWLNLAGNNVCGSEDCVISLKEALISNKTLQDLSLANTNLTSEGAIALAEALPMSKSIFKLDLTYNPLDMAGVLALSVSLRLNQSVIKLDVLPFMNNKKGAKESDSEMARLLNDIDIYCRRNLEIKRSNPDRACGSEFDLESSTFELRTSQAQGPPPLVIDNGSTLAQSQTQPSTTATRPESPPPPRRLTTNNSLESFTSSSDIYNSDDVSLIDRGINALLSVRTGELASNVGGDSQQHHQSRSESANVVGTSSLSAVESLTMEMGEISETASVLEAMVQEVRISGSMGMDRSESQEDLMKQLYRQTERFKTKLQTSIASGLVTDEGILDAALALNDRLETTISTYESAVAEMKAANATTDATTVTTTSRKGSLSGSSPSNIVDQFLNLGRPKIESRKPGAGGASGGSADGLLSAAPAIAVPPSPTRTSGGFGGMEPVPPLHVFTTAASLMPPATLSVDSVAEVPVSPTGAGTGVAEKAGAGVSGVGVGGMSGSGSGGSPTKGFAKFGDKIGGVLAGIGKAGGKSGGGGSASGSGSGSGSVAGGKGSVVENSMNSKISPVKMGPPATIVFNEDDMEGFTPSIPPTQVLIKQERPPLDPTTAASVSKSTRAVSPVSGTNHEKRTLSAIAQMGKLSMSSFEDVEDPEDDDVALVGRIGKSGGGGGVKGKSGGFDGVGKSAGGGVGGTVGSVTATGLNDGGDDFLAELDDQMREIDDFLNATTNKVSPRP